MKSGELSDGRCFLATTLKAVKESRRPIADSFSFPVLCTGLTVFSVLAFQPGGLFRFVWAKVLILIVAVLFGVLSPRAGLVPRPLKVAIGVAAGWVIVAMLLSESPLASLLGRWPRYEGILTLGLYIAIFFVGTKILGGNPAACNWQAVRLSLSAAAILLFALSGLEAAGLRPIGGALGDRTGATLGNATDQGLVGLVIAGVLSAPFGKSAGVRRWLPVLGFASAVMIVLLSASRAALMGLVIVVIMATLLLLRKGHGKGRKLPSGLAGAVAAVAGSALLIPPMRERLFSAATVDGRTLLWSHALDLVEDHLAAGVGPSGFVDALPAYVDQSFAQSVGDRFPTDSPHSWPLQLLVAGGVPLLIIALVGVALFIRSALTRISNATESAGKQQLTVALAAVCAYGLALLTHFTSPGTTGLVAFLAGGLVACQRQAPGRPVGFAGLARAVASSKIAGLGLVVAALAMVVPAAAAEWSMADGARAAREGDIAGAENYFERAYSLRPWDSDTSMLAAQAFAGPATDGDPVAAANAVRWGNRAMERTPHSLEAGIATAIGHIYSGDLTAAKSLLDTLAVTAPYSSGVYLQRGVANFGLGRPAESIADLEEAAMLDPKSGTPWSVLAGVYQRLGDTDRAQDALQHAQDLGAR